MYWQIITLEDYLLRKTWLLLFSWKSFWGLSFNVSICKQLCFSMSNTIDYHQCVINKSSVVCVNQHLELE